jgi:hypothetical protein
MRTHGRDGDDEIYAPSDPITATIAGFCKLSGIGRTKTYELLDAGEIESIHIGTRRLIIVDSYRRLLARLRAAGTSRRLPPMGRLVSAHEPPPPEATRTAAG